MKSYRQASSVSWQPRKPFVSQADQKESGQQGEGGDPTLCPRQAALHPALGSPLEQQRGPARASPWRPQNPPGLELFSCEELGELWLFNAEKGRFQSDFSATCSTYRGLVREMEKGILAGPLVVGQGETVLNCLKGRFILDDNIDWKRVGLD